MGSDTSECKSDNSFCGSGQTFKFIQQSFILPDLKDAWIVVELCLHDDPFVREFCDAIISTCGLNSSVFTDNPGGKVVVVDLCKIRNFLFNENIIFSTVVLSSIQSENLVDSVSDGETPDVVTSVIFNKVLDTLLVSNTDAVESSLSIILQLGNTFGFDLESRFDQFDENKSRVRMEGVITEAKIFDNGWC